MANKGAAGWRINWKGAEVLKQCDANLGAVLVEIGLRVEAQAKRKLQKSMKVRGRWQAGGGRGLRTGTLRRSIHSATPGYNWAGDNTAPSEATPELGGQAAAAAEKNGRLTLEVGSGLEYAMAVHQNHYNPDVLHFLTAAADEVAPEVPAIIARHKLGK